MSKEQKSFFETLAESINRNFAEPFVDKGLVNVCVEEDEELGQLLSINIGSRDAQFDKNGECVSSGSYLGSAEEKITLEEKLISLCSNDKWGHSFDYTDDGWFRIIILFETDVSCYIHEFEEGSKEAEESGKYIIYREPLNRTATDDDFFGADTWNQVLAVVDSCYKESLTSSENIIDNIINTGRMEDTMKITCPDCKTLTEDFIAKAKRVHGDKYDYSLTRLYCETCEELKSREN